MTTTMQHRQVSGIIGWLKVKLRSIHFIRKIVRRWTRRRDIRIAGGVGAGLRFNIAGSSPEYAAGSNELPVQNTLASHLRAGDVFFDIGANIGFFTTIAARLVGPQGKVCAFEPVPGNVAALKHNLALNDFKNVQIFPCAVSNQTGTGELMLADWMGGASLSTAAAPPDLKGMMTVDLITIDELVMQKKVVPPALVKIDVEGAEEEVLKGMTTTIRVHQPVIIYEIDDENQEGFDQKQAVCETLLKSYGYQVTRLEDSYQGGEWLVGNYLAIPNG